MLAHKTKYILHNTTSRIKINVNTSTRQHGQIYINENPPNLTLISFCNFINKLHYCNALLFLSDSSNTLKNRIITEKLGDNHQLPRSSLHVLSWTGGTWYAGLVCPCRMHTISHILCLVLADVAGLTFHLRTMTASSGGDGDIVQHQPTLSEKALHQ